MGAHRERGMSAPNSPGGGARNRKKFQTAAQLDEAFDNFKAGQKDEDTEKSGKQKMKGFMKDVSTYGPMVMLCLFAGTVMLLTISQSLSMYDDSPEEDNYYNVLGIKRMSKQSEIQVAHDKLIETESNENKRNDIEEAFSTIRNTPPNWGRLMTKSAKILKGYSRLGRINLDEQAALGQELQLVGAKGPKFKLPMIAVIHNGKVVPYKGEARILKICDFLGDQIQSLNVDLVTYSTFPEWRKADDRIKVLLFRKTFTRMVMVYRDAAEQFEHIMKFGEVDVRSRGAVNLWRRFNLRH